MVVSSFILMLNIIFTAREYVTYYGRLFSNVLFTRQTYTKLDKFIWLLQYSILPQNHQKQYSNYLHACLYWNIIYLLYRISFILIMKDINVYKKKSVIRPIPISCLQICSTYDRHYFRCNLFQHSSICRSCFDFNKENWVSPEDQGLIYVIL